MAEHRSVALFREYLRINTSHPTPNYAGASEFFRRVAESYGLKWQQIECVAGKPITVLTLEGSDPTLPSLLLNSHVDVVPVVLEKWHHDPFGAEKDQDGNIFARGSQDMKCVGIQHIEAVAALKNSGKQPLRTIHISLVPDEEIGGNDGMEKWVKTDNFKNLNIGFAMDEGLANPSDVCIVYYGERVPWWIRVDASGPTGHGSQLFGETAVTKVMAFLSNFVTFRNEQLAIFQAGGKKLGDVTTVNINMLKGGVFAADGVNFQTNIIPPDATAAIDMRVAPDVDLIELDAKIQKWSQEAGVSISWLSGHPLTNPSTSTDPVANPYWAEFAKVLGEENIKYELTVFPAATDSRFVRRQGIPAIGFSPMNHTPVLLHDHDEFLNEKIFLRGVEVMTSLVSRIANLPRHHLDR